MAELSRDQIGAVITACPAKAIAGITTEIVTKDFVFILPQNNDLLPKSATPWISNKLV